MPVDYSKFDNIEDSDDEREKQARKGQLAKPWEAPQAPFRPPARELAASASSSNSRTAPKKSSKQIGREGRELLDGGLLEEQLKMVTGGASDADALSQQMAKWAPWAAESGMIDPSAGGEEESNPSEPKKLCVRSDGRKKVHTTNPDGSELVEEYDERTDVLLLRKSRKPTTLGGEGEWVFEVGQAPEKVFDPHADMLRPSQSNPIFLRKDTPDKFQWRIRNLPYPEKVYSITIDHEKQQIVVRTSNKKYFKRIDVPDLARVGLKLKDESLSWKHQHNTLIISYDRPLEVSKAEQEALKLVDKTAVKM